MIEEVPVIVYCSACETEKTLDSIQRFCCPTCGTLTPDIVSGKQLELVAIEITESPEDIENRMKTGQLAGITL